jgi:hypothetical protein
MDRVAPRVRVVSVRRGAVRLEVSEPVTLVFRSGGRTMTVRVGAGRHTLRPRHARGRHRLSISARDAAGNAARTIRIVV